MRNWEDVHRASTEEILGWAGEQNWATPWRMPAGCPVARRGRRVDAYALVVAQAESLAEWPSLDAMRS